MGPELQVVVKTDACGDCGFCRYFVTCSKEAGQGCNGCLACIPGCPNEALAILPYPAGKKTVSIRVDGRELTVPRQVTIRWALERAGYRVAEHPDDPADVHVPCGTGGCWACMVLANGEPVRACVESVRDGMEIVTDRALLAQVPPRLIVSVYEHLPYHDDANERLGIVEVTLFAHGCNYRCPMCHNWDTTFSSAGEPDTPQTMAARIHALQASRGVNRVGISGGEVTLNRRWVLELLRELRRGPQPLRIQLDSNASLLTPSLIDELLAAGVTEMSPDVKGLDLETFMRISGLEDRRVAERYHRTAWEAVEYLLTRRWEDAFIMLGVVYHPQLISDDELARLGARISSWRSDVPIDLLEYQPAFRRRDMPWITREESERACEILRAQGLTRVLPQTRVPVAAHPDYLLEGYEF